MGGCACDCMCKCSYSVSIEVGLVLLKLEVWRVHLVNSQAEIYYYKLDNVSMYESVTQLLRNYVTIQLN